MSTLQKFLSYLTVALFAGLATLQAAPHDAKVVKITGTVEVMGPGDAVFHTLRLNDKVPEGSKVRTGADGVVYIEAVNGIVATLKEKSEITVSKLSVTTGAGGAVTSQDAQIDLKHGNLISTLNPKMKDINHYGVKTPKGVAAARGTVYGVAVIDDGSGGGDTTVATFSGVVRIYTSADLSTFVDIPYGTASANGAGATTLQDAISSGKLTGQDITDAVKTVADNVKDSTSAVNTSESATSTLAAVVNAAAAADPSNASSYVKTAVAAVVSSTSATGSGGDESKAVAAITEAATRGAPGSATDIAKSAATAVVETNVTEAVNKAKSDAASKPGATQSDIDAAAKAAADKAASDSKGTLDAVAQGVVNGAGANADKSGISNATNSGASTGASNAGSNTGTTPSTPPSTTTPTSTTPSASSTPPVDSTPITPVDPGTRPSQS